MFIEMYQVEEVKGVKFIHYNGFTHFRYDDDRPYGATEGAFCYVPIGENNYERACMAFELCAQYETEFESAEELIEFEDSWKNGVHLHMDEATQETPCGLYWFELDE